VKRSTLSSTKLASPAARAKRALAGASFSLIAAFLLMSLSASRASADVGVVLNETLDVSVARITGSGHTAVYFSRICPESPVRLRLCRPGEEGSVMSNYINLGEDQPFEWNIVPLSVYVYGVQEPRYRPLFGSEKIKAALEDRYRDGMLSAYCTSQGCKTSDKSEWREMAGAGLSRSMYIFVVETSVQQDLDLIEKFNALPNENHFNGVTNNCADFTKGIIDSYFPHSAHRDYINDFGMTSPKAVARSFTHYAESHPEARFRVLHFSQLPGTIKRSSEAHSGTEQLYHSKKLLVPMVVFADHELVVAAAAYALTGRFNPEHEFEKHPAVQDAATVQVSLAMSENGGGSSDEFDAIESQDREQIVGSPDEWNAYRTEFDAIVAEAVREEIIPRRRYLKSVFKRLDATPTADANGSMWLEISDGSGHSRVGLSANNILAPDSDARLAYQLLLARTQYVLKSPKHSRETMLEFKEDWALLQYARTRCLGPLAESAAPAATAAPQAAAAN